MSVALYQVDAFTTTPFAGNPAAVCLLPSDRNSDWMQALAAEMNLSETAFLQRQADQTYRLRWFTPAAEVDLCGHATLASAHVLWTEGHLAPGETARFDTNSGSLSATRERGWITMNFPTDPVSPVDAPSSLRDALPGVDPVFVGTSGRDYLVHLPNETAVRELDPDLSLVSSVDGRGVIVTAAADRSPPAREAPTEAVDFVSRFFAPGVGVPEDPVTGSAHCALGPYWAEQTGQTTLVGHQVSDRGGIVRVQLDAPTADRVDLSGRATTVVRGRLEA